MIIKRLLIISFIGIMASFSLLAYLIAEKETSMIEKTSAETASFFATSVTTALKNAMREGMPEIAKNIVNDLNRNGSMGVSIYKPDGTLAFGEGDLRIPGDILDKPRQTRLNVNNIMFFITPLANESSCRHCHSADGNTLGIAVIKMPTGVAFGNVRDTEKRLLLFGILLVLAAAAAVFFVTKRMMLDPVMKIHHGMESFKSGDLSRRVSVGKDDEIGALAKTFNEMAERLETSHAHMEKAINEKTRELRVIADLSLEVFKGDLGLEDIIDQFLCAITGQMGYGYSALCLVDKETGMLSKEFRKGIGHDLCAPGISLASDHPFSKTVRKATPSIRRSVDIGAPETFAHLVIIPILSHQRKRCSFVNRCTLEDCPAFHSADERCWLIDNTHCRSPKAVAGNEKIFGCVHCEAFPVMGVLIAARDKEISKSSLHSMEILASEITSAIENQRFIESKKEDIETLIKLHDISIESLQGTGSRLTRSIVSCTTLFSDIDASILWLAGDDGKLLFADSFNLEKGSIPDSLIIDNSFVGRAITDDGIIETADLSDAGCLRDVIHNHCFMYAASVPLKFRNSFSGCLSLFRKKDYFMTDSEKLVMLVFASQAASALNSARLYSSLKSEKEFSDAIFNSAASGIIVLARNGHVLEINRSGAAILGIDPSKMIGRRLTDIFPDMASLLSLDGSLSSGRELSLSLPDGRSIPIGYNSSRLFDPSTGRDGIIAVFRDMSEIKRLQAELKRKHHFETMGKVVSGVAHEIRNPLFGISSIGQILEREIDTAQHKALIQAMLKEANRMKQLIEELLLYTRPSRLEVTDIDICVLFDELSLYTETKRTNVDLMINIPPLLVIKADRDKITQVFLNILNNALDAAKGKISVSASASDGITEIRIADDGEGIRDDDMERIFDPFFTTKKGGTGLGLPICRKIMEDHGGQICVRSMENRGTTVTLTFKS